MNGSSGFVGRGLGREAGRATGTRSGGGGGIRALSAHFRVLWTSHFGTVATSTSTAVGAAMAARGQRDTALSGARDNGGAWAGQHEPHSNSSAVGEVGAATSSNGIAANGGWSCRLFVCAPRRTRKRQNECVHFVNQISTTMSIK